jgi:hypothetical protein
MHRGGRGFCRLPVIARGVQPGDCIVQQAREQGDIALHNPGRPVWPVFTVLDGMQGLAYSGDNIRRVRRAWRGGFSGVFFLLCLTLRPAVDLLW